MPFAQLEFWFVCNCSTACSPLSPGHRSKASGVVTASCAMCSGDLFLFSFFFFLDLFLFLCVDVLPACLCVHMCSTYGSRERNGFSGTRITDGWYCHVMWVLGAQALCKNTKCSLLLSHLSSPLVTLFVLFSYQEHCPMA